MKTMQHQDTENLFRRFKGKLVTIKTISGGNYDGKVGEITNDFVSLAANDPTGTDVYLFFGAIESVIIRESL